MQRVLGQVITNSHCIHTPHNAFVLSALRCFASVSSNALQNMRNSCMTALTDTPTNKRELERAISACVNNFVSLATSKQHNFKMNAMDAIGLIKLCRKGGQPSHIGQIWPHIQALSMLPAKDDRTSCTLIGSAISCALEAKDSDTAACVWEYLHSSPQLPLPEVVATQLLSALRNKPHLVVQVIEALHKGTHRVHAKAQHFAVAMQSLADSPVHCKQVFETALKHKMVDGVTLVVLCQVLQQAKDFVGALDTLSIADTLSITPIQSHYTVLLSCAAEMNNLEATKRIHAHLSNHAVKRDDILLGALMKSYSQCGDFEGTASVFEYALKRKQINEITLVVWCQALRQHNDLKGALSTLSIADSLGITPVPSHYTVLLSCAAEMNSLAETKRIHEHLSNSPVAKNNAIISGALIQSYSQCGEFESAASVFTHALEHKQVSSMTLAVWCQALQQHNDLNGALNTLAIADSLSITPAQSHYTVLLACAAELNSLEATKRIHSHMCNNYPTSTDSIATGALVHSYAQCGDLDTAVRAFEDGLQRGLVFDVKGWTNLVSAYACHGMVKESQATLQRMVAAGVTPNERTATCLLNAASHAGLGLGVRELYHQLQMQFPDLQLDDKLRTCVVDGLARAGLFEEAVTEARSLENDVAWNSVLGAARSHNHLDVGVLAFNELKRLSTDNAQLASAHVQMAHIYTSNGRSEEASQLRQYMKQKGLHKQPGQSSIEVDGVMHTFRVNDTSHPEMKQIVELNDNLHEQLKANGYVPDVVWASRSSEISGQTKEQLLCEHSERFALVYGLLHSTEGQPLTIFKNLRVCGDCHNATKHASKVLSRKLTVKDMNRWHVFENGKCSCGDFW